MKIALFGNPNTGKTTVFNHLTDSYAYVGNWSGVTVEKKIGKINHSFVSIIDLPGVYSLNPLTKDEAVATHFLLHESFDQTLNILNAAQLKRNLLLTIELLEYGKPTVLVLNMMDIVKKQDMELNPTVLANELHATIFQTDARTNKGMAELKSFLIGEPSSTPSPSFYLDYGEPVEAIIRKGQNLLTTIYQHEAIFARWMMIQFLAGNNMIEKFIATNHYEGLLSLKKDPQALEDAVYAVRLEFIEELLKKATLKEANQKTTALTKKIDHLTTHPIWGMPLFLMIFYFMFKLTFDWIGGPLSDLFDAFLSGPFSSNVSLFLTWIGANELIHSLIIDGLIAGVGGVLVFMPQIFVLFACISFLEDSGYMARAALVMDRLMESVGLNGKAFIPLLIGFGCNVPGIMAARTIEQPKERLITTLISPFMSCSARLPIYSLFIAAFFEKNQALIVLSLYVLGILVAIILAKFYSLIFKTTDSSIFIVDLPEYNLPKLSILWRGTWDKGKGFVKKAGTVIFGGTVLIWSLSYFNFSGVASSIETSFMAAIGSFLAPFFAPLGFYSWQAVSAIITGILAKEVVGSTMLILFHVGGETALIGQLSSVFTPLQAYSFLVFVLLYIPCFAVLGAIRAETGSWFWSFYSALSSFIIAYGVSFMIYQTGMLFHF
ncbi:ferrous iron transport protein B [Carnobacterium divergens]|uniref:ferrous iron transport protein B n=1 Tax=Carnobacterium divergens TaxID=2748 RepID=UPI000E72F123|nr:ferrous iron transport protein B [Carnobacterium divergens]ANZ99726.1 ferrous iron transport protein B [Carnobacterium divergens]TFI65417.1 ferrous iron transport protein B [Carnobacterium divergens]TFI65489.1 ferrous iron transport protein B [Carnobacterium divergens]TFI80395.1 ferrous iron transport protein B [Carnobacterium divergens]TFJ05651.1 ferrous iron transport protein B [Carnobacterium divergens]